MAKAYSLAALSGLLLGQAILPQNLVPLVHGAVFLGFLPLWWGWLKEQSVKRIFLTGWLCQFLLTLIGFNWVAHTVSEFGRLPFFVSLLALFGYCALANLHIPLAGVLWHFLFRRHSLGSRITGLALITALLERFVPMIFDWHFGYVWLFKQWPGMQAADLVGFSGLSSLSILLNGIFLYAWAGLRSRRAWWIPVLAGALVLVLVNLVGAWRLSLLPPPDAEARILLVQANIGNRMKHLAEHGERYRQAITEKYFSVTEQGLKSGQEPQFALWPETAFPEFLLEQGYADDSARQLEEFLREKRLPLAVGSFGIDAGGKTTNSLFFFNEQGKWGAPPYAKTMLLAFGEYIPGASLFPQLKSWLPAVRDFGRGPGPGVVRFQGLKLGPQICYEGLFDWFSRRLALEGAEILVNVTNDSWYGTWQQPYQHLTMTLAKAVELRLPLVRATNTGISAAVLATGEVVARSPIGEEWAEVVSVAYEKNPGLTFFARAGWWVVPLLLLLALSAVWLRKSHLRAEAAERGDFSAKR